MCSKKFSSIVILFLFQWLCCAALFGQNDIATLPELTPSYSQSFDHFKTYPSMCYDKAFWDAKGRMWLKSCGSAAQHRVHLFQFDGYEFRVVRGALDSLSTSASISFIYKERFLMGIEDVEEQKQVISYDLFTNTLEIFPVEVEGSNCKLILNEDDEIFLMALGETYLNIYQWEKHQIEKKHQIQLLDAQVLTVPKSPLVTFDREGGWIFDANENTFSRFDGTSGKGKKYSPEQLIPSTGIRSNAAFSIDGRFCKKLSNGFTYFKITQNGKASFVKLEEKTGKTVLPSNIPKTWIPQNIYEDNKGNHLLIYEDEKGNIQAILEVLDGKRYNYTAFFERLLAKDISSIYSPDFRDQILICNQKGFLLHRAKSSEAIQNVLQGISIRAMAELPDDQILVLSQNHQYPQFLLDLKTKEVELFHTKKISKDIDKFGMEKLIVDEHGMVWGCYRNGILKYDSRKATIEQYPMNKTEKGGFRSFAFVDQNQIVVLQSSGLLHLLNIRTKMSRIIEAEGVPVRMTGHTHHMIYDKNGLVWLATSDGLVKVDLKTGARRTIGFEPTFKDSRFMSIEQDEEGKLWLGTPLGGLHIYDPISEEVKHVDSGKGLSNNTIASILEDDDGDRWIGTYNGISIVNPDGELLANLYEEDGLVERECNRYATLKTSKGKLLIGTVNGLNIIDPKVIKKRLVPDQALKIYLTSLRHPDPSDNGIVEQYYGLVELGPIELPATNRFLNLRVATSNYFKPEENQYAYLFEGIDKEWTDLGNQNVLNFNNLPSGNYRILIKGSDGSGNWTPTPLAIDIHARTIFYKQFWFYVLLASLFFGGAFLWITRLRKLVKKATEEIQEDKEIIEQQARNERIRAETMEQQALQIEQQAQKLSQSLAELQKKNDEIIITQTRLIQQEKLASLGQLTAGIAHEIKNPLNFINNFAEGSVELLNELLNTAEKNKAHLPVDELNEIKLLIEDLLQNAVDIKSNGHRLDRIVKSMMDHARGTNQEIRPVNINQLVDDNINLAYHGYRAIEPSFNVHIQKSFSEKLPQIAVYPQELGRVILNLLNNAFYVVSEKNKKAKDYRPTVKIDTQLIKANGQGKYAQIRIWDNGKGISKAVQEKIFEPFFTTKASGKGNTGLGLSISYDIVTKQHQGQLLMESQADEFTQFIIKLPINE